MSRAVLQLLRGPSPGIEISGASFQKPGAVLKVRPESSVVKVLCKRHNESLSPLDDLAARLFRFVLDAEEKPWTQDCLLLLRGEELERWMLKVLCGVVAGDLLETNLADDAAASFPPTSWLRVLFGDADLPVNVGLHIATHERGLEMAPRTAIRVRSDPRGAFGVHVSLTGIDLLLSANVDNDRMYVDPSEYVHRPTGIQLLNGGLARTVHMAWSSPPSRMIRLRRLNRESPTS